MVELVDGWIGDWMRHNYLLRQQSHTDTTTVKQDPRASFAARSVLLLVYAEVMSLFGVCNAYRGLLLLSIFVAARVLQRPPEEMKRSYSNSCANNP